MGAKSNKKSKSAKDSAEKVVNPQAEGGLSNLFKWLAAVLLLAGAIYLDYHYFDASSGVITKEKLVGMKSFAYSFARVLAWLVFLLATFRLAITTTQGALAWSNMKKARNEMFRVTWPTREETVKMALILICIVIFMGFLLWIIDYGYIELTRFFVQM